MSIDITTAGQAPAPVRVVANATDNGRVLLALNSDSCALVAMLTAEQARRLAAALSSYAEGS